MEEVERRRKPKPSAQGLHEELSTELTQLSGKKAIFRDALKYQGNQVITLADRGLLAPKNPGK